jgi:DNA modification methylase
VDGGTNTSAIGWRPSMSDFDVKHRDCFDSLAVMRDAGGCDLILTSPPYPEARTSAAYGGVEFDASVEGFGRLGEAIFGALKPGGVCALNIDGPIRIWRPELGETERSLIAFRVAIDWSDRVGFRYLEHGAYVRWMAPIGGNDNPRWRSAWEPIHIMSKPGGKTWFDRYGSTREAMHAGLEYSAGGNLRGGRMPDGEKGSVNSRGFVQPDRRALTTAEHHESRLTDRDHVAAFTPSLADDYILCYSPPGGLVGDPFVGSGTVAFSCHRHGRRFIGGDLGHRERDGRRWADVVNDGLRQERLFPMEAMAT